MGDGRDKNRWNNPPCWNCLKRPWRRASGLPICERRRRWEERYPEEAAAWRGTEKQLADIRQRQQAADPLLRTCRRILKGTEKP